MASQGKATQIRETDRVWVTQFSWQQTFWVVLTEEQLEVQLRTLKNVAPTQLSFSKLTRLFWKTVKAKCLSCNTEHEAAKSVSKITSKTREEAPSVRLPRADWKTHNFLFVRKRRKLPENDRSLITLNKNRTLWTSAKLIFTAGPLHCRRLCYFVTRRILINFSPSRGSVYQRRERTPPCFRTWLFSVAH